MRWDNRFMLVPQQRHLWALFLPLSLPTVSLSTFGRLKHYRNALNRFIQLRMLSSTDSRNCPSCRSMDTCDSEKWNASLENRAKTQIMCLRYRKASCLLLSRSRSRGYCDCRSEWRRDRRNSTTVQAICLEQGLQNCNFEVDVTTAKLVWGMVDFFIWEFGRLDYCVDSVGVDYYTTPFHSILTACQ